MTRQQQLAEMALCFVGLGLGLASWALPLGSVSRGLLALAGLAVSLVMIVRLVRRRWQR